MSGRSLLVLAPGLLTTVQDLGRPGLMRYGVTPGGALDRGALILGNRLVGNEPGEAALEVTLVGPRLRFTGAAVIAVTGADLGATRDGTVLPRWTPVAVAAGDEIEFRPRADDVGARAYLCVAGGLAIAPVMGSRSTDLFGGFGGWQGRALRAGDELPLGEAGQPAGTTLRRRLVASPPEHDPDAPVRVVLGPQTERFTAEGSATFLGEEYTVSPRADRMGLRLTGPAIAHSRGADLISEGIAHGAVQVPGDGRPIVLLAGRQTVGGYPKIATAIGADLDGLGQRRPGDRVRFRAVEPAEARALTLAALARLGADAVTTAPRPYPGWTGAGAGAPTEDGRGVGNAWDSAGVARLVAALGDANVTSFRLELADIGLKLEFLREPDGGQLIPSGAPAQAGASPTAAPPAAQDPNDLVTAPLLGIFYRRSAPNQPPLVEEGHRVEAGQLLGLIEVMKTYHEVTAPRAGVLAEFLVEDGQSVEYGQAIARLESD